MSSKVIELAGAASGWHLGELGRRPLALSTSTKAPPSQLRYRLSANAGQLLVVRKFNPGSSEVI